VVTLLVPRSPGVAVTVAYPTGTDRDPADRHGLAQLLAEVQMTAAAGDIPARSRGDLESLRPLGWSVKVGRKATLLSEVASRAQLPGTLRQVATRMRGATPDAAALQGALAALRRDLGAQLFGTVDQALYFQVRELAFGVRREDLPDRAELRALDGLSPAQVTAALRDAFDPGHAVLALAGDFSGLDLRALIAGEFGTLPATDSAAARPASVPRPPPFHPAAVAAPRPGLGEPEGVVAVTAPALTDSLHPRFFLALLLMGEHVKEDWGVSRDLPTRFRYSLLDEPDLVRFYPKVAADSLEARALSNELRESLVRLVNMIVLPAEYDAYRHAVLWLIGGPMPANVLAQVRQDGAALNNVCVNLAARELTGGEKFWSVYRRRFLARGEPGLSAWAGYLVRPDHQAALLFTPATR